MKQLIGCSVILLSILGAFSENPYIKGLSCLILIGIVGGMFLSAITPEDRGSSSGDSHDSSLDSNLGQGNGGG